MKLPLVVRLRRERTRVPFPVPAASTFDALSWRFGALRAMLSETLQAELDERRGFLWLAVAFGTGALVYFDLPAEPWLPALIAVALVLGAFAWMGWQRGRGWRILALLAVAAAGMTAGALRVWSLDGPAIVSPFAAELTGRVVDRDSGGEHRPRVVIDRLSVEGKAPAATPDRLRITLPADGGLPLLGSTIHLRVRLAPVPGASMPGAYDPRMAAFFQGIRGSGFALGAWHQITQPQGLQIDLAVARIRQAMVDRISAALPPDTGAMAAALLVGDRSGITDAMNTSLRLSGLAHILSISGLHMMLIAGVAFAGVRGVLALSPGIALRRPIRKWAALAAILVVTGYFVISGGGAATLRSYVMASIMFAAILVDRPAISMRNLALAAFVTVVSEPESVTEPGFQMSFAAVAALIAAWEAWRDRPQLDLAERDALPGLWLARAAGKALVGVTLTTVVASAATRRSAPTTSSAWRRIRSSATCSPRR